MRSIIPITDFMVYSLAIEKYGEINQLEVAIEELSELIKEITKFLRNDTDAESVEHITEEMADVYIILEQLRVLFKNDEEIERKMRMKIDRLYDRLPGHHREGVDKP